MRQRTPGFLDRERGAMTLMVGLTLLMGSTILTVGIARMGMMEQRIANNELRAKEAHQSAQAGLDYALAWLTSSVWTTQPEAPKPGVLEIRGSGNHSYEVQLTLDERPGCLRVHSRAQAIGDASLSATASECLQQRRFLNDGPGVDLPPLVVNGCLPEILDGVDLYPCDPDAGSGCEPVAVVSSQSTDCLQADHPRLNGGSVSGSAFEGSAWDHVFSISKDELKTRAGTDDPTVIWIQDAYEWSTTIGRPDQPAFIVFSESAGCPRVTGSPTVYGIVYFEHEDGCGTQGWGGATVYGSVVFEGTVQTVTSNSVFRHWSWAGNEPDRGALNPIHSAHRVPGSWRDWEPEG